MPALVSAGIVCLPAITPAQSAAPVAAAKTGLPQTIRLVRQGQAGDRYALKTNAHYNLLLRFEKVGDVDETASEQIETGSLTSQVRSITPEGNVIVEERIVEGKRTTNKNGERDVTTVPPAAWLVTYLPDGKRTGRTPLPDTKATGQDGTDAPPVENSQGDDGLINEPPFPAKALRVGDTWTGEIPMLPKEVSADPRVSYTAKLTAIERRQDVPCARVEYTLSATSKQLPELLTSKLSELAKGVGTVKMDGTITVYYTLDRGVAIDREDKSTITMRFNLSEPDADTDELSNHRVVKVTIKSGATIKTTKVPAYMPSLVPSAAADK
jgi:hypothetical protein